MLMLFRKDMKLFFNDQKSFVLTFLLPVILITLFAFAYGGIGANINGSDSIKLQVVDLDRSVLSGRFISDIDSIKGITIINSELDESRSMVIKGKYSGALVFKEGFQDSVINGGVLPVELFYDKEQEFEISLLQSLLTSTLLSPAGDIELAAISETGSQDQDINQAGDYSACKTVNKTPRYLKMTSIVGDKNDLNLGLIQAVAGTAILMLLFSVAGIGTSILEEKENGTINRLLYSPLNSKTILYSKMLFAFFVAVLQLTVMFIFSWLFLHLDITVNIPALILMILSTAFAVSSIGIFLAALAKSRQQALSLSTLVILVMSAIGGSMIPLFIMPDIMSRIALFSVNYWGIQGFYDIFWRSLPLSEILPRILTLTGTGIILTIISLKLFNKTILNMI